MTKPVFAGQVAVTVPVVVSMTDTKAWVWSAVCRRAYSVVPTSVSCCTWLGTVTVLVTVPVATSTTEMTFDVPGAA